MPANNFPNVVNGSPVDGEAWFNAVAQAVTALQAARLVADNINNSSPVTSASSTEVLAGSFTAVLDPTQRYTLMLDSAYQSSALGDIVRILMRYKAGSVVDSSGTQFGIRTARVEVASSGTPLLMRRTLPAGLDGTYTVGVLIDRAAGTGTVSLNANSTDELYTLLERST